MSRLLAVLLAATAMPGLALAQGFSTEPMGTIEGGTLSGDGFGGTGEVIGAPWPQQQAAPAAPPPPQAGRPPFSLYQGSEASITYGYLASAPGGSFSTFQLDTRHTLWLAPFLGTQFDLGLASLDWDDTAIVGGLHVHFMPETGGRFGVFYLPAWESGFDERLDNYGIEGMFGAMPGLTVEARAGRFEGDGVSGPYFGARGFYALNPEIAVTATFQHSRLDAGGADINSTDAILGAEYFMPGTDIRVSGGLGVIRFAGDVPTDTDFRLEVGATIFAFGEPASTARMRTFGRQTFLGTF